VTRWNTTRYTQLDSTALFSSALIKLCVQLMNLWWGFYFHADSLFLDTPVQFYKNLCAQLKDIIWKSIVDEEDDKAMMVKTVSIGNIF